MRGASTSVGDVAAVRHIVLTHVVTRSGVVSQFLASVSHVPVRHPRTPLLPPVRLVLAALFCLAAAAVCVAIVHGVPRFGLTFQHSGSQVRPVLATPRIAVGLQRGDSIIRISAEPPGLAITLQSTDLLEEPDYLVAWPSQDAFFARQDTLQRIARLPRVTVLAARGAATPFSVVLSPEPASLVALRWSFWLQLVVGAVGLLVGAWIWALRPTDWSARFYALTGLGFLLAVYAAAAYGARELALPASVFRTLSALNHLGGMLFAGSLCAFMAVYPRQLIRPARAVMLVLLFLLWWSVNELRLTPDQRWSSGALPVALLLALGAGALQWRATRGDPADRAVIRWLGATVLSSCTAIVIVTTLPVLVAGAPVVAQSIAFLLILPMYLGMAVGLRQNRLFALDEWAIRLLFWALTLSGVILIDLWLIATLGSDGGGALWLAALLVLSTMPLRRWVWGRFLQRTDVTPAQLFRGVLNVAAAPTDSERDRRWRDVLQEWFLPLHAAADGSNEAAASATQARLMAQGRELTVPATAASPALRLSYASGGARLFTADDVRLVDTARTLLDMTEESRTAHDTGVKRERVRIARDLHDTVSSPLLAGLVPRLDTEPEDASMAQIRSEIRRAVDGMRSVVADPDQSATTLMELLADLRFATVERLTSAGLTADWPIAALEEDARLSAAARHALSAFVQEAITNVIRHAGATTVHVRVDFGTNQLTMLIADDGRGFEPASVIYGDGLSNLQARATVLGGSSRVVPRAEPLGGTAVHLQATLRSAIIPA